MLMRIVSLYVSLSLAALPFTKAMAEAANHAAAVSQAKALAREVNNNLSLPAFENGSLNFGSGINGTLNTDTGTIDVKTLFPGESGGKAQSDFESLYGKDDALAAEAAGRTQQLESEHSAAGDAWRAFDVSVHSNARPDLSHDPFFKTTDLMHTFVDSKTPQCAASGSHTPQLVTCRRPTNHPKFCTGSRTIKIHHHNVQAYVGGKISNHGTVRAKIDLGKGGYAVLPGSDIFEDAGDVSKLDLGEICGNGAKPKIQFTGSNPWTPPIPGTKDSTYDFWVEQQASCDNGLVAIIGYKDKKGGKDIIVQGVQLLWDIYGVSEDTWTWDRSDCPNDIALIESGSCSGNVTCDDNPNTCVTVEGLTFCDNDLKPPPASVPRACKHLKVNKQCGASVTQDDECAILEKPSGGHPYGCAFLSSQCVQQDENGRCLVNEDTYDCGRDAGSDAACQAALAMTDMVQDCQVTETQTTLEETVHNPKYVTCEVLHRMTTCEVSRDLSIGHRSSSLSFNRGCFDHDTITYRPPWTMDRAFPGASFGSITVDEFTKNLTLSATANLAYSGKNTSAAIAQYPNKSNDWTAIIELSGPGQLMDVPNPAYENCIARQTANPTVDCSSIPPTVQELQCPPGTNLSATLSVSGDVLEYAENHTPAEPENNPCLKEPDDWTTVRWVCNSNGGTVGGYSVPPDMLFPLYPGDSGSCQSATAVYDPIDYNVGTGTCWTDPQGDQQCLDNTHPDVTPPDRFHLTTTNCTDLENNPSCTLVDTRVVKNSNGYGGFAYVTEKRYDCGDDVTVQYAEDSERTYNCPSPLQCMGESCLDHAEESTRDFKTAVALLEAAQQAQMDLNCAGENPDGGTGSGSSEVGSDATGASNPMNCRVFSGHNMECKQAVGGWQDCCIEPQGVSLGNYIELIMAVGRLDSSIMALNGIQQLQGVELVQSFVGSWETLRTPVVSAWSQVTQPFTSAFNTIVAETLPKEVGETVTDVVTKGPIDAATDALMTSMQEWVNTYFSGAAEFLFGEAAGGGTSAACGSGGCEAVANEVGQQAADEAAQTATEGAAQVGGLVGMVSTLLNVVMIAYAIYAILDILVSIIWKCDMEEFQLGVQKQLRNCHYVGSYCKGFLCIEKRESYCCFNSPLARIINVQAKQQLGIDEGDPEDPNCSGLSIEQLGLIDWNRIDLSEWIDILMVTGHFPTRNKQEPTMENLTGSGSFLNVDDTNPRPNLEDRTRQRVGPLNVEDIRSKVMKEIYP